MLRKLFKYEWKAASQTLIVLHAIVLLFAVFTRISFEVRGGIEEDSAISGLLLFLSIMITVTAAIFTVIFIGYRFYKSVFTDEGYLTNTLPVTPKQLIISKGLTGVIWQALDIVIVFAAVFIIVGDRALFEELAVNVKKTAYYLFRGNVAVTTWLVLITVVLTPFAYMLKMYASVSLGSLFSGHKLLGAVGSYIGIYIVEQIIMFLTIAITGNQDSTPTTIQLGIVKTEVEGLQLMNTTLAINIILTLVIMFVGFFVTKYIKEIN